MTRRQVLQAAGVLAVTGGRGEGAAMAGGRLKQSVARWCYRGMALEDLCRAAADIGIVGIDLVDAPDWPTVRRFGLTPAMVQGKARIPVGWNHKENHHQLAQDLEELIVAAAEARVPNVITFSGNRAGISDEEGKAQRHRGIAAHEENRRGPRGDHLHGTAEQQGRPHRLPGRPHRVGRGSDEGRGFAARETALRHLPHADHGRRHHPHDPRKHRNTSATFTPAACRAGTNWTIPRNCNGGRSRKAIADLNFAGLFRARIRAGARCADVSPAGSGPVHGVRR